MKKLILLILLTLSVNANANDFWEDGDGYKRHVAVSTAISASVTAIARNQGYDELSSWFMGFGTSLAIGVAKEYADGKDPENHTEDVNDIYADIMGSALGATLAFNFEYKF